ncbi:MAG: hypothetical protein KC910_17685 [Candidatus Eremiobacteraeota bacterium]|nr:hypothetical protein [Candidatus Eremiobacteraeota bacterium]
MAYRVTLALLLALLSLPLAAQTPASGYDTERREREDRLLVPTDQAEAVWNFMRERFLADHSFIQSLDPRFTSTSAEELFTDTYFDVPDLKALAKQDGIRHRRRVNLTNPNDRKSGRELVQVKLSGAGGAGIVRSEFKYEVRSGRGTGKPFDNHPLIGLIKRPQRQEFIKRVQEAGLDPLVMRPVLTIVDRRQRIYLLRDGQPFISMTLDTATTRLYGVEARFVEFEPEPGEIIFTEASPEEQKAMVAIIDRIVHEMTTRFPDLKRDLTPKYNKMFQRLEEKQPMLRQLAPITPDELFSFVLAGCCLLAGVGYLLYRRVRT